MTSATQKSGPHEPVVFNYRMWRSDMRVQIQDTVVAGYLDRLCHQFSSKESESAIYFDVRGTSDKRWEILREGEVLATRKTRLGAARHAEWRMVREAVRAESEFIHWHGSALTKQGSTLLIPGKSGTGKSTLSLALAANGFQMLGDDIVFMDPVSGEIHPFHRAIRIHNDAIERLAAAGFPLDRDLHVGTFLEVEVLRSWSHRAGPPLSHVFFVDWDVAGPVESIQISQAEAALELRRFSYTLKKSPPNRAWRVLQRILAPTVAFRVLRGQDLAAAVRVISKLVAK